jgi:hypothetical protein
VIAQYYLKVTGASLSHIDVSAGAFLGALGAAHADFEPELVGVAVLVALVELLDGAVGAE